MSNQCRICGNYTAGNFDVCADCTNRTQNFPTAEKTEQFSFAEYHNQPFTKQTSQVQGNFANQMQEYFQCPFCGGAGGVFKKSKISTAGIVYMCVMGAFTLFTFAIFFPCAVVPLLLLFLGFLFKESYLACVNCGRKIN